MDNCTIVYCVVNNTNMDKDGNLEGPCVTENICASTAALAIGLGAGIVAAIVVCGLLALALCSGGAYAAANSSSVAAESSLSVNPLYQASGHQAQNPFFVDQ